jgi:ribosomal-protein-alanine N-acetyltransferase
MTPPGFDVRPLTAADLDAALLLSATLVHAPRWSRAVWSGVLDPHSHPRRIALGVFSAAELAGFAVAVLAPPEAELESIAVAVPFQRRGLARVLLADLDACLRAAAVDTLLLEVRVSNAPAQALYRSLNFVQIGLRPGYYAEPPEDALILRRALS